MSNNNPRYFHLYDINKVIRVYSNGQMELYDASSRRWETNYVYGCIYYGGEPCKEVTEDEAMKIICRRSI